MLFVALDGREAGHQIGGAIETILLPEYVTTNQLKYAYNLYKLKVCIQVVSTKVCIQVVWDNKFGDMLPYHDSHWVNCSEKRPCWIQGTFTKKIINFPKIFDATLLATIVLAPLQHKD